MNCYPGAAAAQGSPGGLRVHGRPALHLGLRPGRGQADGAVRGAQRPPVPDQPDEPGAAQLPVRLPEAAALAVSVLHAPPRAVHQGEREHAVRVENRCPVKGSLLVMKDPRKYTLAHTGCPEVRVNFDTPHISGMG